MNKEEAKAILRSNLKGSKKKRSPLLTIAEAVRLLVNDPDYGSTSKLAESFGVSRSTIEAFDKMNEQPAEIQKLIEDGKIGIGINPNLVSIANIERRISVANIIAGLRAKDARAVIIKCKKDCNLEPEQCKNAVINAKLTEKPTKSLTISLELSEHSKFLETAKRAGLSTKEAAKQAISDWTKGKEKTGCS
jgi:hypothetical protein